MGNGNAERLAALVGYAMARYGEAGGAPVLVVEEGDGRRSVVHGRMTHPFEKDRLVAMLGERTRSVKRWGAVVWTTASEGLDGTLHPIRYAYCTTPDHRAGVLLAQHHAGGRPVGAPWPADERALPPGWRPAPLPAPRSPGERVRRLLAKVTPSARPAVRREVQRRPAS